MGFTRDIEPKKYDPNKYVKYLPSGNYKYAYGWGMIDGTERKLKRVKGYREIPKLIAFLQQKNLDRKEMAA